MVDAGNADVRLVAFGQVKAQPSAVRRRAVDRPAACAIELYGFGGERLSDGQGVRGRAALRIGRGDGDPVTFGNEFSCQHPQAFRLPAVVVGKKYVHGSSENKNGTSLKRCPKHLYRESNPGLRRERATS